MSEKKVTYKTNNSHDTIIVSEIVANSIISELRNSHSTCIKDVNGNIHILYLGNMVSIEISPFVKSDNSF